MKHQSPDQIYIRAMNRECVERDRVKDNPPYLDILNLDAFSTMLMGEAKTGAKQ
jgi:hypothetical protein